MEKIIKDMERRPLRWSDIEGADNLKKNFDNFNQCYKILSGKEDNTFVFVDDFVRSKFNTPFVCKWINVPEELSFFYKKTKKELDVFIKEGYSRCFKEEKSLPTYNREKTKEENNISMEVAGLASYRDSFKIMVDLTQEKDNQEIWLGTLQISYGDLDAKQLPYYSTSGSNRYSCGQCQEDILPKDTLIRCFYEKWDIFHLKTMLREEYNEMKKDLELIKKYGPLHPNEI